MRSLFIRFLAMIALGLLFVGSGCSSPGASTTTRANGDVGGTPATSPGSSAPGEVVLAVSTAPFERLDPAAASSTGDLLLIHQIYDWLVELDADGSLRPGLAVEWEEAASTGWAFTLRPNVTFHDGSDLDAEDVVHTFQRLREIAASDSPGYEAAAPFSAIQSVIALTPERVLFVLAERDPEFPVALTEDAAAVLSADTAEPAREWVGTGPFVLWSYLPRSGAVLKRNTQYWARDAGGRLLPYLDGVDIIFEEDPGAELDDLESGRVGLVGGLTDEQARLATGLEGVAVAQAVSNDHLAVLLHAEPGSPLEDANVRRALKLASDRPALAAAARSDHTTPGNDSPVGPFYEALHLEWSPAVDVEAAVALLAEAGFPDGFALDLSVPDDVEALGLATEWLAQMAAIGVRVTVVTGDADSGVTGGGGAENAQVVSARASVSRFATLASPRSYLEDVYRVGPAEGGALWDDAEYARVLRDLRSAADESALAAAYREAQEILRDRGPAIVPFFGASVVGMDERLRGLVPAPIWPRTSLREVSFAE